MTEIERVQLSRWWKLFQLYSFQIAAGCLSAGYLMSLEWIKDIFVKADLVDFFAMMYAVIAVFGIIATLFSGGIGLFRLINGKRVLRLFEKGEEDV